MKQLALPLTIDQILSCKTGDAVLLSGTIYTARDAVHKKLCAMIERGEKLPFALHQAAIYYAGHSCSKIQGELAKINSSFSDVDGILITHEHSDHVKGLEIISKKYDIPIYANEQTWEKILPKCNNIHPKNIREITTEDFYIKDICVQPFSVSHDAVCPYGYALHSKGKKVSVVTDLGRVSQRVLECVFGSSIVLLEANHDVDMLNAGSYPYSLKRRILSGKGHLSNDDAAIAALELARNGVRGILLGHLSLQNNVEALAYQTVCSFLEQQGVLIGRHVAVALAKRDGMTGCYDAR